MSTTDSSMIEIGTSSSSSSQSSKTKVRPHDPSQLVDVHPPPTLPPRARKLPQRLLPAWCFPDRRSCYSSETNCPYLPSTDPLTWLEQWRGSLNDGDGASSDVYPTAARSEHVHWRSQRSEREDEHEPSNFKHGVVGKAKEKGKRKERERKIEAWDWEAWERGPAEQERRRAVQRNNERRLLSKQQGKSDGKQKQDVPIEDGEDEESDDTYADIDSISILEASSIHTKSRPSSSDGPIANRPCSQSSTKNTLETHPSPREQDSRDIVRMPGRLRSKFSQRREQTFTPTQSPRQGTFHSLPPEHPKAWHHCHLCRLRSECKCNDPSHNCEPFRRSDSLDDGGDDEGARRTGWLGALW